MMFIGSSIANIMQRDTQELLFLSAFQDTLGQRALEHSGKKRKDIDMHITVYLNNLFSSGDDRPHNL
jgi:predicted DCC family thiol-disulfide oxidoreductase YuxK